MQTKSTIEMFVLSGEQTGARRLLDDNAQFSISGKMDTDVVFRDPSIMDERINLTTLNNEVFIEVLSGDIEVQGKVVHQGTQIKVPEYSKVKIGETTFSYGRKKHSSWHEIIDYVSQYEIKNITNITDSKSSLNTRSRTLLLLVTLIFILVGAIIIYSNILRNQNSDFNMFDVNNINSVLIEKGFETLTVESTQSGEYLIKGFLMTNRERSALENIVDEYRIPARLKLTTGDQIAREVSDLYRVNGIDVDVKAIGLGTVIVTTSFPDKKRLEKVKDLALKEIPSVTSLETEYINTNQNDKQELVVDYDKNDKRITMVVDGVRPYIMTADQSKYYIGALLPTGHKVLEIKNQTVMIEKEGEISTLKF
jgi:type III secretion protein D